MALLESFLVLTCDNDADIDVNVDADVDIQKHETLPHLDPSFKINCAIYFGVILHHV